MEVIFLTTLFSIVFAIFFLLLFLRVRQKGDSCADQDSLIPFRNENDSIEQTDPTPSNSSPKDFVPKK